MMESIRFFETLQLGVSPVKEAISKPEGDDDSASTYGAWIAELVGTNETIIESAAMITGFHLSFLGNAGKE